MTREQIVKMTKMTLARTLASGLPMSDKHRQRLQELKDKKEAERDPPAD
jgi:hypothetical protein